jgi:hypothetical protein
MAGAANAHHRLIAPDRETRQTFVDEKHRDALGAGAGIGDGGHQEEIREGAVADEMFVSGQPPTCAIACGARPDAGGVGTGAGFGDGDGGRAFAADRRFQPTLDLLAAALQHHLVDVAERTANENVGPAPELLLREHLIDGAQPAAAEVCRNIHRIEAEGLGLCMNRAGQFRSQDAGRLNLVFERGEFRNDEGGWSRQASSALR